MGFREIKIEGGGLWIEDRQSKEDSIMPQQHLIHTFTVIQVSCNKYQVASIE